MICIHDFNINLIPIQKGNFKMEEKNYHLILRKGYLNSETDFIINTCLAKLSVLQVVFLEWF